MNKLQFGSNDGLKCCPKECPERSAECRKTCERWKKYREKQLKEYEKRARAGSAYLDSQRKQAAIRKNARKKMNGH